MFDAYKDLLGVKFKEGGRNVEEGLDCYGLCMEGGRRAGGPIHKFDIWIEELVARDAAIADGKNSFEQISSPEPFCVVTFKIRPPYVTHMGIVLEDCVSFIHILGKTRVTIARLDNRVFKAKLDGYYRYTG